MERNRRARRARVLALVAVLAFVAVGCIPASTDAKVTGFANGGVSPGLWHSLGANGTNLWGDCGWSRTTASNTLGALWVEPGQGPIWMEILPSDLRVRTSNCWPFWQEPGPFARRFATPGTAVRSGLLQGRLRGRTWHLRRAGRGRLPLEALVEFPRRTRRRDRVPSRPRTSPADDDPRRRRRLPVGALRHLDEGQLTPVTHGQGRTADPAHTVRAHNDAPNVHRRASAGRSERHITRVESRPWSATNLRVVEGGGSAACGRLVPTLTAVRWGGWVGPARTGREAAEAGEPLQRGIHEGVLLDDSKGAGRAARRRDRQFRRRGQGGGPPRRGGPVLHGHRCG